MSRARAVSAFAATLVACAGGASAPVARAPVARSAAASAPTYALGDVIAMVAVNAVVASGPNLVTVSGTSLQIHDGASGKVLASTQLPEAAVLMAVDAERLYVRTKTNVVALDAQTAKPRWTSTSSETEFPWSDQGVSGEGVLAMKTLETVAGKPVSAVYAFDAATGRVRFRKDDAPYAVDVGGGRVFFAYNGKLAAYDAVTGAKAWSVDGVVARRVLAEKSRVVVAQPSSPVLVLDAATGKEIRRIEIDGGVAGLSWTRNDALLDGDTLFLYITKKSTLWATSGPHDNAIVAIDVARGLTRWSTPPLATLGWRSDTKLVRSGDAVAACADSGVVRVLDVATGAERGVVGSGSACGLAATTNGHVFITGSNASGTSPWVARLVASSTPSQATTVVRVRVGIPSGDRDEIAAAGEGARVFVGGAPAHEDGNGRWVAKTTARGSLAVMGLEGDFEDDCAMPHAGVTYVDLPGAGGEVEANVTLGRLENICPGSD